MFDILNRSPSVLQVPDTYKYSVRQYIGILHLNMLSHGKLEHPVRRGSFRLIQEQRVLLHRRAAR